MEQRPVLEKPRPLLSAIIVNIISFIIFLASILCFIGAIGENSLLGISRTIIGLSGVAISALFTIIATIAEDVHYQRYASDEHILFIVTFFLNCSLLFCFLHTSVNSPVNT